MSLLKLVVEKTLTKGSRLVMTNSKVMYECHKNVGFSGSSITQSQLIIIIVVAMQ